MQHQVLYGLIRRKSTQTKSLQHGIVARHETCIETVPQKLQHSPYFNELFQFPEY